MYFMLLVYLHDKYSGRWMVLYFSPNKHYYLRTITKTVDLLPKRGEELPPLLSCHISKYHFNDDDLEADE